MKKIATNEPVIPAGGSLESEDHEFEAGLGCTGRLSQKIKNKNKEEEATCIFWLKFRLNRLGVVTHLSSSSTGIEADANSKPVWIARRDWRNDESSCAVPPQDPSSAPHSPLGSSQLPVTMTPGSSDASGFLGPQRSPAHSHAETQLKIIILERIKLRKKRKIWDKLWYVMTFF